MLTSLLVLCLIFAAEPNEAEKLFREMETKVNKAQSIEYAIEIKFTADGDEGSIKGVVLVDAVNKIRGKQEREKDGIATESVCISDGIKLVVVEKGAKPNKGDFPSWLHQNVRAAITRAGDLQSRFVFQEKGKNDPGFDLERRHPVSDFKLGKKEMIGQQEAQEIHYTVMLNLFPDNQSTIHCKAAVWIDTKTQLPLKRTGSFSIANRELTFTETITKLKLDGKIDPKLFELPKE